MQRFVFTEDRIRKEALPPNPDATTASGKPVKDTIYWDKDVPGFGVRVGRPRTDPETGRPLPPVRTFIFQRDVRGRTRRFTIGRHGRDETREDLWTVKRARARAVELLNYMLKGLDPTEEEQRQEVEGMTLAVAIGLHVRSMRARECAEKSILDVHRDTERYMPDWLSRPIASITRAECMERHALLTARGKYVANRAMRIFRAVWNTAARANEALPQCPVVAVTMNKERRRREPITWDALPAWWAKVDSIANPIRRDLQLFILFTGLRSTDAKTVRWEHVNLGDEPMYLGSVEIPPGCIHRPKPKGGEDRAFTVPLSSVSLEILRRRRDQNRLIYPDDKGWVFPSTDAQGRVSHVHRVGEQRYDGDGRKYNFLPSPHRLRDTFATAAASAGVEKTAIKVLMNHVLPRGDVTEGYIGYTPEMFREPVQRIADFLLSRALPGESGKGTSSRTEAG